MIRAGGLACKRIKTEDSDEEVGDGTRRVDIISQLERVPNVLEEIFLHLDIATVCECVIVSTTWKRLITSRSLWKNLFLWREHLRVSSTWRTFSARMEYSQPQLWNRMKIGDSSSYREACQYVQGNIQQIPQFTVKDFNFQVLPNRTCKPMVTNIRLNEKHVFIGGDSGVRIFNRWTRELVKVFHRNFGFVNDMQLNERFLVVQFTKRIDVYDVQKLVHIQPLENKKNKKNFDFLETKFVQGLDHRIVVISNTSMNPTNLMFEVHRWNLSAARFFRDPGTEHRLKVDDLSIFPHVYLHVDEKYLIVDFPADNKPGKADRRIKVLSLETMQLVIERQFVDYGNRIRSEYHDGGIVVKTCTTDGQPYVALWDVDKDTVQPIADHPSQFEDSFAMAHHPFQIVLEKKEDSQQLLLVRRCERTRNCVIAMSPQRWVDPSSDFHFSHTTTYFDGLQMITESYDGRIEVVMADLID